MTQPGTAQRLSIVLDTQIALEALVLYRLQRLPDMRRQEWLRGLLIQGFRLECQAIRAEQSATNCASSETRLQTPYAHWLARAARQQQQLAPVVTAPPEYHAVVAKDSKPFAALSKVIG